MTTPLRKPKKKVPLPLKRTRKELPPPSKPFKDKKAYNRRAAKEELKRTLREASRLK